MLDGDDLLEDEPKSAGHTSDEWSSADFSHFSPCGGAQFENKSDELPEEIRALEQANEQIVQAIKAYSISHTLERKETQQSRFEQVERSIKDREEAIRLYQEHLERISARIDERKSEMIKQSIDSMNLLHTHRLFDAKRPSEVVYH